MTSRMRTLCTTLRHPALLVTVLLLLLGATLVAQEQGHRVWLGTTHYYKLVVTDTNVSTTSSETFVDVPLANPAGTAYALVRPNSVALVNVRFTAESRCTEAGGAGINWCEIRILVGGVEAAPAAAGSGSSFAFDSTDSGAASLGDYEGHAMDRHRCVRNATAATAAVPVQVQWKVTNFDAGAAPLFWLDDWSLTIESAPAALCPAD